MHDYKLSHHETGYSETSERSNVEPRLQADFSAVSIESASIVRGLTLLLNLIVWRGDNHDG